MDFVDIVRQWLLRPDVEGKHSNDPDDPGGLTKWGITVRDYPEVINPNFSQDDAEEIYYQHYWKAVQGEQTPWPFNILLFDMAVNMGVGTAIKIMQRGLGVLDDGIYGDKTHLRLIYVASNVHTNEELVLDILSFRAKQYFQIVLKRPTSIKYARGWAKRMFRLFAFIKENEP